MPNCLFKQSRRLRETELCGAYRNSADWLTMLRNFSAYGTFGSLQRATSEQGFSARREPVERDQNRDDQLGDFDNQHHCRSHNEHLARLCTSNALACSRAVAVFAGNLAVLHEQRLRRAEDRVDRNQDEHPLPGCCLFGRSCHGRSRAGGSRFVLTPSALQNSPIQTAIVIPQAGSV